MKIEEEIYFPALHGLRTDVADELAKFLVQHDGFREEATSVHSLLAGGDVPAARSCLECLARRMAQHEQDEEDLMARISDGDATDFGQSNHN